ncbi:MAG: hypothetical protein VW235_13390, partial [Rhodospirillaceae bacterium]
MASGQEIDRPKIGDPVLRKEDSRLIIGKGNYSDDAVLPDQVYSVMVRSPYGHAKIKGYNLT